MHLLPLKSCSLVFSSLGMIENRNLESYVNVFLCYNWYTGECCYPSFACFSGFLLALSLLSKCDRISYFHKELLRYKQ